jgi:hypothetical protein
VRLYAACFEPEDEQRVDPPLHAQLVTSPAPYFEHDALIAVFANRRCEWANADFVGVLASHGGAVSEPAWAVLGRQLIATGCGYDAYGFRADDAHATAWRSLGRMETRALDIARHLLVKRLGVPESLVFRRVPLIRANRWIARKAVFERFVKEWLIPARAALADAKDRELEALLRPNQSANRQPIPPEPWLRRGPDGSICASYHPYVLERLAPLFFVHGGYRVRSFRDNGT